MSYFLLVYDRRDGRLIREPAVFADADAGLALKARFEMEDEQRAHPNIEVVLLGSDSLETLRSTHARYFKSLRQIATST